jgi:hypothetical protein
LNPGPAIAWNSLFLIEKRKWASLLLLSHVAHSELSHFYLLSHL